MQHLFKTRSLDSRRWQAMDSARATLLPGPGPIHYTAPTLKTAPPEQVQPVNIGPAYKYKQNMKTFNPE